MAVEHLSGSRVMANITATPPTIVPAGLFGGRVRCILDTVEVSADASVNSTYTLARVPANGYPLKASMLYWDDLADTGAPDLKVGLFGEQITDDDDAFLTGLNAAAAGTGTSLIADIATIGKPFWGFVTGQAVNPGGELDIKVTLFTAGANLGGTLSLELFYAVD